MTTEIELVNGSGIALIDDADFPFLSGFRWYRHNAGYAVVGIKSRSVYMHRLVTNAPRGLEVDHINGDKLDNRRSNLRLCTRGQNKANVGLIATNRSGFKGVSFLKRERKYRAAILNNGRLVVLGYFDNPADAARAYDREAVRLRGEFAKTNEALGLL